MPSTEPKTKVQTPDEGEDLARIGLVIDGRYRLDKLLGRGGMGVVYKAEHIAIRRPIAIKLLHPTLAAIPELRARFEREAIAIGRIDHPNCVGVSDFGRLGDGTLFLVMDLLDGRSLGELMDAEAPLPAERALRLLRHVLSGLGHAHQQGIVHRDVKPENVYVVSTETESEFAKILDFGIAKMIDGREVDDGVRLTQAGVAFGTPVYMSPEQALGSPLDGRSDLYGASVMAYEMICGRPPFWSDDKLEILSMHTSRPPPSMTEMLSRVQGQSRGVPAAVEEIIRKGLAKRREERWTTAGEYIAAIDQVQALLVDPTYEGPSAPPGTHDNGLTPTPALALDARRPLSSGPLLLAHNKRKPGPSLQLIAGLALVGAAALGVLIAVLLRDPAPSRPRTLDPTTTAGKAAALLDRGKPGEAIKIIEAAKKETATDPESQLLLGHAYQAQRKNGDAVAAYKRAVELDPRKVGDASMRSALRTISTDTDVDAAMAALSLRVKIDDGEAKKTLIELAGGSDMARRRPAAAVAEKLGLGHEVDWLQSYLYDLEQRDLCSQRKDAVIKLRALGDKKAIPALEQALFRKGKVGKWKGKNVNECLVDDAKAAITFLSGVQP
jgi:serine/threonine protein kinase